MKAFKILVIINLTLILMSNNAYSQAFDIDAYKTFLKQTENLTSEGLINLYPVGYYKAGINKNESPHFLDSIKNIYSLTPYECQLLEKNKFMVSERLSSESFGNAIKNIWRYDLPLFITSDAILHALHKSYNDILKKLEVALLIDKLDTALMLMHNEYPTLKSKYSAYPEITASLDDYDVFFTIARKFLSGDSIDPNNLANNEFINVLMDNAKKEYVGLIKIFSSNCRFYDFSQMTPRGHYTQSAELKRYFKAMMWLGRTEFYLIAPQQSQIDCPPQTPEDIRRQIIDVILISEASEKSGASRLFKEMDDLIKVMVGESDNVKLEHIGELMAELEISSLVKLIDLKECERFKDTLNKKSYAWQKILSQILFSDPGNPDQIVPASSFLLLGQRFIVDSYVFSNVVYDRISYNNQKVLRMMPSSLDALFALGNNAAADLLKPELARYPYSSNLANLRYLIDSYEPEFWQSSIYNNWLNSIRSLNPPSEEERKNLPDFMQTAAWEQSRMNTQLASWAQLRHDNLLYAKQSYTGGITCSFPHVYVEPVPNFYSSMASLALSAGTKFNENPLIKNSENEEIKKLRISFKSYFTTFNGIMTQFEEIANKEIKDEKLTSKEIIFLQQFYSTVGCGSDDGIYGSLFFSGADEMSAKDFIVADVHTQPTDEAGDMIGKIFHVGTGQINLGVVIAKNNSGEATAFVGPFMSYYEYFSLNFDRLTDEEWRETYLAANALRHPLVDLYLADMDGNSRSANPVSLPIMTDFVTPPALYNNIGITAYPNPAVDKVFIAFNIPQNFLNNKVKLEIFDTNGNLIRKLFEGSLLDRNYLARWDGEDSSGRKMAAGIYIYQLLVNNNILSGKILFGK